MKTANKEMEQLDTHKRSILNLNKLVKFLCFETGEPVIPIILYTQIFSKMAPFTPYLDMLENFALSQIPEGYIFQ